MEEQLRQLMAAFSAFKEEMKADQISVKEKIEAEQEEMEREITYIIENKFEAMEGRTDTVETKVGQIEERVSSVKEQIEEFLLWNNKLKEECLPSNNKLMIGFLLPEPKKLTL
ncbi:hypothetical protein X975_24468, partial [Stegodyphus mimosarum]